VGGRQAVLLLLAAPVPPGPWQQAGGLELGWVVAAAGPHELHLRDRQPACPPARLPAFLLALPPCLPIPHLTAAPTLPLLTGSW
jgi:hypothetical protein